MSNQEQMLTVLTEAVGCCSPLAREPLSADQAVELARLFRAMGDPVRLRLLSLIASHAGGEACVCDLTGVFELTVPTISLWGSETRCSALTCAPRVLPGHG